MNDLKQAGFSRIWLYGLVVILLASLHPLRAGETAQAAADDPEWTQFGHDPARSNHAPQTMSGPWQFAWDWNSADENGKTQPDHLTVPDLVQPVSGGGRVYMIGGDIVHALDRDSGALLWTVEDIGTLSSTPAYADEFLYVGSQDGNLYQLNAADGTVAETYSAGSPITDSVLMAEAKIIFATAGGSLVALEAGGLDEAWVYEADVPLATAPAYSPSRGLVVVVAQDLYVHAVDFASGEQRWHVKPTVRDYSTADYSADYSVAESGWPVIAEQHGVVFVRYRLDWDTLWHWSPYPTTNAEIRANLMADPRQQVLFALDLESGETAFIPAVGNGGAGDGGYLPMGPLPVIRMVDGQEVAYIIWRNGQTCAAGWCDGREDATMGEMVLDDETVPGYVAGDVRFIEFDDIQTDEMMTLTMVGDLLFHGHWLINAARTISDRSPARGETFTNPIQTTQGHYLIWRQCHCPAGDDCNPVIYPGGSGTTPCGMNCPFNASTRACSGGLFSYGDQRGYPPGFYQYHNDADVALSLPFTIASGNKLIVKTFDGGLMAFTAGRMQGSAPAEPVLASQPVTPLVAQPVSLLPTINPAQADAYLSNVVRVCGTIRSIEDYRPKALYMSFTQVHDGELLVRVFEKDIGRFGYDLYDLLEQDVCVTGFVRLYYPEFNAPEIIVEDPRQIALEARS